jgi:hypothetical protein
MRGQAPASFLVLGTSFKARALRSITRRDVLTHSEVLRTKHVVLSSDFHFCRRLANLLMPSDAFIHAGFNAIKTLRRTTPKVRDKTSHFSYRSTLPWRSISKDRRTEVL